MSEDIMARQEVDAPRQFLIMADDLHVAMLSKLLPGLMFLQVEGMAMIDNTTHQLLVNPLPKVVTPEVVLGL